MSTAISPVVGVLPRIDWSNPITRGLVALCVPLPGSNTYIELVTGSIGTPTNMNAPKAFMRNGGKSTVPWVYAPQNDGTATSRVVWPASATVRGGNLTSQFSVVALAGIGAGNGTLGVIGGNGDTVSTGNGIGVAIDNGYIAGYGGIRGVVSAVDSTPIGSANAVLGNPTSDRVHCFGFASDGATVTWLHEGKSSQSTYAYNEASSANRRLAICGPATGNGSNNKVFVGWFALWDRPISVAEYASLYADSWQLLDDDGATFGVDEWIPVSAGGGGYTLTAASASFTTTGNATGLAVSRLLTATKQSYALTGNAAALTYTPLTGYTMTAQTAAFTVTGTATGLTAARQLIAEAQSYTLTGYAPTLTDGGRKIVAQTAAYALTGNAATLTTTGTVEAPAPDVTPAGKSKRKKRDGLRRVIVGDTLYEVPERDLPALLEAQLLNRKPPRTAQTVAKPAAAVVQTAQAPDAALVAPDYYPSVIEAQERYTALMREFQAQADADVRAMLDRVASRVLAELEDEEDAAAVLLMQ